MEILLLIVLGIALAIVWNSSRDAIARMRYAIDRLEQEVEFLRTQVAALVRTSAARPEQGKDSPAAPQTAATSASVPASVPKPEPAQAAHAVPSPVAPFTASQVKPAAPPAPSMPSARPAPPVAPSPMPEISPTAQTAPKPPVEKSAPEPRPAVPSIPIVPPQPESAATPAPKPGPPSQAQPGFAFQSATAAAEPARARLFSLEETLGANWLNKIGIAILVIGLAFFLAYKLQSWGPGGKIFCGFAVSVVLLGGGIWLERKPTYRVFARGGIGGGWALAYFTTFAAYHLQAARVLDSLPVDLLLMLLIAAGMVGHSLLYRSQTVTSLAFMLGFATLLTSHVEEPTQTVFFSLAASAILAIALVIVTTLRHWAVLELCGLVAVYVSHLVWLNEVLPNNHAEFPQFWASTALILLYWLIFRLAYVIRTPLNKREEDLSSVSAILNSGGVLGLLKFQSAHPEWAFWALLVLGILEMALAWWAKSKRRQAFVILSTIAVVLLVSSVPFRFHGVSWPVLWLIQAQVLAIAGLRLGEPVFRRLGLLVGLITGAVLGLHDVMPLAFERLVASDFGTHWSLAAGLSLAAILYWTHSEVYPRRWPEIEASTIESLALKVTSWLGLSAAATCLWVVLPERWVPAGWLGLVLTLGLIADWIASVPLGLEADGLAVVSLLGIAGWDLWRSDWNHRVPLLVSVVLLYFAMSRKTVPGTRNYVPAAYSWSAAGLLFFFSIDIFRDPWIAPAQVGLCLILFEIGRLLRKGFLRWQGYAFLGFALIFYLGTELSYTIFGLKSPPASCDFTLIGSDLLEVLILVAGGYWLYERMRSTDRVAKSEHVVGLLANCAGTLCLVVWFGIRFPFYVAGGEGWVTAIWAAMATVLMALARVMRRRTFVVQGIVLAVAAVLRGLLFDLVGETRGNFWQSPLYHLSITAVVLIAALPSAFPLRGAEFWEGSPITLMEPLAGALRHPEQWFFFAPFGMMVVALAVKLSSGHITIAWSLLGLGAFLFALIVGERSFRLAGLGLLLVSVAKILLMDVWKLAAPDRYTTLIVLGLALLAVSFLYTRFSTTIRKYL